MQGRNLVHVKNAAVPARTAAFVFPASHHACEKILAKSCVVLHGIMENGDWDQ